MIEQKALQLIEAIEVKSPAFIQSYLEMAWMENLLIICGFVVSLVIIVILYQKYWKGRDFMDVNPLLLIYSCVFAVFAIVIIPISLWDMYKISHYPDVYMMEEVLKGIK